MGIVETRRNLNTLMLEKNCIDVKQIKNIIKLNE